MSNTLPKPNRSHPHSGSYSSAVPDWMHPLLLGPARSCSLCFGFPAQWCTVVKISLTSEPSLFCPNQQGELVVTAAGIPLSTWIFSESSHSLSSFLIKKLLSQRRLCSKRSLSISGDCCLCPLWIDHSFNCKLSFTSTILTPNSESHSGSLMLRMPWEQNL